jgi:hypothetical protein
MDSGVPATLDEYNAASRIPEPPPEFAASAAGGEVAETTASAPAEVQPDAYALLEGTRNLAPAARLTELSPSRSPLPGRISPEKGIDRALEAALSARRYGSESAFLGEIPGDFAEITEILKGTSEPPEKRERSFLGKPPGVMSADLASEVGSVAPGLALSSKVALASEAGSTGAPPSSVAPAAIEIAKPSTPMIADDVLQKEAVEVASPEEVSAFEWHVEPETEAELSNEVEPVASGLEPRVSLAEASSSGVRMPDWTADDLPVGTGESRKAEAEPETTIDSPHYADRPEGLIPTILPKPEPEFVLAEQPRSWLPNEPDSEIQPVAAPLSGDSAVAHAAAIPQEPALEPEIGTDLVAELRWMGQTAEVSAEATPPQVTSEVAVEQPSDTAAHPPTPSLPAETGSPPVEAPAAPLALSDAAAEAIVDRVLERIVGRMIEHVRPELVAEVKRLLG